MVDSRRSQLTRLSERRRLFNEELYQATLLMGLLTMHCYDAGEDEDVEGSEGGGSGVGGVGSGVSGRGSGGVGGTKSRRKSFSMGSMSSMTRLTKISTDHTEGLYLLLVGRAMGALGSTELTLTCRDERTPPILSRSRVHIFGRPYRVEKVLHVEAPLVEEDLGEGTNVAGASEAMAPAAATQPPTKTVLTLSEPLLVSEEALATAPKGLSEGKAAEVWIFLEQRAESGGPNPDMQLLLYNMKAHKIVQRLLRLPVEAGPTTVDGAKVREVLLGAYRLLKALCIGFKVIQLAVVADIPLIVGHIDLKLVSHDITPTGCLNAIMQGNPQVCLRIGDDLIRRFVRMAAKEQAPRFLRFLRNMTGPENKPILRNQFFVIQALSENALAQVRRAHGWQWRSRPLFAPPKLALGAPWSFLCSPYPCQPGVGLPLCLSPSPPLPVAACLTRQVLFQEPDGRKEREALCLANDHEVNPRGRLAYHIELISLIARCTVGVAPGPEAVARAMLSVGELLSHLVEPHLPLALKVNYLAVLDEAYLYARRPVEMSPEVTALINYFSVQVCCMACHVAHRACAAWCIPMAP